MVLEVSIKQNYDLERKKSPKRSGVEFLKVQNGCTVTNTMIF
jgi:hypothetical protein